PIGLTMQKKRVLLALILTLSVVLPQGVFAAPASVDLGSTTQSVTSSAARQVVINVGGTVHTVLPGQKLTPAEQAAANQVLNTGKQSLTLSSLGNAVSGHLNLSTDVAAGSWSSLVIPKGVLAISNAASSPVMNVTGNLTNGGQLFLFSSNP